MTVSGVRLSAQGNLSCRRESGDFMGEITNGINGVCMGWAGAPGERETTPQPSIHPMHRFTEWQRATRWRTVAYHSLGLKLIITQQVGSGRRLVYRARGARPPGMPRPCWVTTPQPQPWVSKCRRPQRLLQRLLQRGKMMLA